MTSPQPTTTSSSSSFSFATSIIPSSPSPSPSFTKHPGQPVPPIMTTGLRSWPEDDTVIQSPSESASASTEVEGSGGGKLWLVALLPLFLCVAVALYFCCSKLQKRAKNSGGSGTNRARSMAGRERVDGIHGVGDGAGLEKDVEANAVTTTTKLALREKDDDERTLVGKDELLGAFVKAEEKLKANGRVEV